MQIHYEHDTKDTSSIAEVYIGLITACMPFLPAFWKHHFGEDDSAGYTRYGDATHDTIELRSTRRGGKRSTTVTTQKTPDYGSDENVLIGDPLAPPTGTSKRVSSEQASQQDVAKDPERFASPPSPAFGGEVVQITKTVEIKQTYDKASEKSLALSTG